MIKLNEKNIETEIKKYERFKTNYKLSDSDLNWIDNEIKRLNKILSSFHNKQKVKKIKRGGM